MIGMILPKRFDRNSRSLPGLWSAFSRDFGPAAHQLNYSQLVLDPGLILLISLILWPRCVGLPKHGRWSGRDQGQPAGIQYAGSRGLPPLGKKPTRSVRRCALDPVRCLKALFEAAPEVSDPSGAARLPAFPGSEPRGEASIKPGMDSARAPRHWIRRVAQVGLVWCHRECSCVSLRSDRSHQDLEGSSAKDWVAALQKRWNPKARWEAFRCIDAVWSRRSERGSRRH